MDRIDRNINEEEKNDEYLFLREPGFAKTSMSQNSLNRSNETSDDSTNMPLMKKKSIDADFRAKYKTEICKFWGVNKDCRYGDNV